MERGSWLCTVFTQVSVCVALYVAFNLGHPRGGGRYQNGMTGRRGGGGVDDVYFVTVRGGVRPEVQQNRVLTLMEKVARAYRVEFVVDITEDRKDDALFKNGTEHYRSLKVPWYTAKASTGGQHYVKLIKIPQGETLALIGVDAGSLPGLLSVTGNEQPRRLVRTLIEANSLWSIHVGLQPVVSCHNSNENMELKHHLDTLYHEFPKYGVNAYLSGRVCTDCAHQGSIDYVVNPDPWNKSTHSAPFNGTLATTFCRELVDGILLHRVNSQEIATYFISLSGEEVYRIVIQKKRKEVLN